MMEEKKKDDALMVNDGKGIYDSSGLIDTLIVDLNEIVKALADAQYIRFCVLVSEMAQKLAKLKVGVPRDLKSKDEIIADLQRLNDELAEKAFGMPVEKEKKNGYVNASSKAENV